MAIAKVVYKSSAEATPEVWMDTTDKTAANANMLSGITALKNDGTTATGTIVSQAAQTIHPSTSDQTIASGQYLTGAQTIAAVTTTNLSAENIVSGVTVKIGDASDDDCVASVTGTASGGGGGGSSGPVWIDTEGYVHLSNEGNGGSTSFSRKDVNFYDYDGTIVASFTTAEFANLEALPANPSHDGLTAQGWNMPSDWTLANAKTYISTNKKADWGQMYTTTSGATEIDVEFTDPNRLSPIMSLAVNGTVSVDWGDGSSATTVTGSSLSTRKDTGAHTYPAVGKYTIKITATTGNSWGFYGTSSYLLLYRTSTLNQNRVYSNCVQSVRIGAGCTAIGNYAFYHCASLASVTIPNSVTSIGSSTFQYCYSLTSVTIPNSVTSFGDQAFYQCSLASITIPTSVTSIGNSAISNSYSLTSVTIPNSVTSIGSNVFATCYSLAGITIPSSVTSIATKAFTNCYGLGSIHFKPTTPPSVAASDAFNNLPTDCKIYVPTGYLTDYTTASNYPDPNTYTYVEE